MTKKVWAIEKKQFQRGIYVCLGSLFIKKSELIQHSNERMLNYSSDFSANIWLYELF